MYLNRNKERLVWFQEEEEGNEIKMFVSSSSFFLSFFLLRKVSQTFIDTNSIGAINEASLLVKETKKERRLIFY